MHISNLDIQSFRSIGRYKFEFEPRQDNDLWVIVGENNAGKSTILKALDWLIGDKRTSKPAPTLLHDYDPNVRDWNGQARTMHIRANDNHWHRVWTLNHNELITNEKSYPSTSCLVLSEPHQAAYLHHLEAQDNENTIWGLIHQEIAQHPTALNDWVSALEQALRGTPGVTKVTWKDAGSAAHSLWLHDGTNQPIADKGPGLQKLVLLFSLAWLVQRQAQGKEVPWVIAWDEPEAHLHPQLMRHSADMTPHVEKCSGERDISNVIYYNRDQMNYNERG